MSQPTVIPSGDLARLITTELSATGAELGAALDAMDEAGRLAFLDSLGKDEIVDLFERLALRPAAPADFVSPTPGATLICEGINSLPLFRRFQKRFAALADGQDPLGYNHQPLAWLTGPGYFKVSASKDRAGEVLFDYTALPERAPSGWPPIQPNDQGFSALVYAGMVDVMRRISRDLFVGAAYKQGRRSGDYFVLCRTGWPT